MPDEEMTALSEDARQRFESLYERLPSWEVPYAQPAIVELADRGEIRGLVLDAGCGTGENALHLAERGHAVWGVDIALPAIGMARAKAAARGLARARFIVGDALRLEDLGMTFDTVIDSGLLHAFTDRERACYIDSLGRVLAPGGRYHALGFSDRQAGDEGPRRLGEAEIRTAFVDGWRILRIEAARFMTRIHAGGAHAWLISVERSA